MNRTQAFDAAFAPTQSQIDRLARCLYQMTAHNGFTLHLEAPGLARVGGVTVTDYDCSECGEDMGVHAGRLCDHQHDLLVATGAYMDELPLPFDGETEFEYRRWKRSHDGLLEAAAPF